MHCFPSALARMTPWLTAFLLACCMAAPAQAAPPSDTVSAAVTDLYAQISAQNLAGVQRYLAADGFSEVGVGDSAPHRLGATAFEQLFHAGLLIELHTTNVQTQVFGDTAIVTGMRVGAISPKDKPTPAATTPFTMVWTRNQSRWLLRHVHLSATGISPSAS